MDELDIEYRQWLFFYRQLYPKFTDIPSHEDEKSKRECVNVLQHWLFEISQDLSMEKYQNLPLLPVIKDTSKHLAKLLINGLKEKKLFWRPGNEEHFVLNLLAFINDEYEILSGNIMKVEPKIKDDKIIVGEFHGTSFINQKHFIRKYELSKDSKYLRDVTRMILRYESMGNGSYQWGDTLHFHRFLYQTYNVRYEGFASPINSRMLYISQDVSHNIGHKKKKKKKQKKPQSGQFCSLFPAVDLRFGSLGNFFKQNLREHVGAWSVNPPFVNSIMTRVSRQILDALEAGVESQFFCTYPHWSDSEGWLLLEKSVFCRASYHRNQCALMNTLGEVFAPPRLSLSLFCLSWRPLTRSEMDSVRLQLTQPVEGCHQSVAVVNERHQPER